MAKFGWCLTNHHDKCIEEFERYVIERGNIVKLNEIIACECKCHDGENKT